jgi:DNA mismatch repair protein MutL
MLPFPGHAWSNCLVELRTTRIRKLEDQLSNQIAAGEVVERPGAALKEMVENSLDANAKHIRVHLRAGGVELLEVADDGHGIDSEDLLLALDRHATSKISSVEDLFAIRSWGFRGEALASIGAVSRLTLSSRRVGAEQGKEILTEGGKLLAEKWLARPVGTTVRVENLFFNTPARRKFLKSQAAESSFCLQTLHRLALGSPECAFEASLDGERALLYPAASSMEARIVQVYREAWKLDLEAKDLLKIEAESGPLRLHAWMLPSRHFIPSSRGILSFVNKRSVKDKLLQQAILAAAKEVLFGNLYPQLVLHLELDPELVDVNVHPTKSELRFRDSGHVFAFVRKHLERALAGDRPVETIAAHLQPEETAALFSAAPSFHQKVSDNFSGAFVFPAATQISPPAKSIGPQFLGTLKNTYLVCQEAEGLLLVDQHAAHERVTYERLRETSFKNGVARAPLLIPIQIELPRESLDRLEEQLPALAELGLVLDRTGPSLLAVRELPVLLLKSDGSPRIALGEFLRKLLASIEDHSSPSLLTDAFQEKVLDALASQSCHGSVRAGQTLSAAEAYALLEQMSETDFAGHCPHGRPTAVRLRWSDIERLFKRIT